MGSRNFSKTSEKSSSSPRAAGVSVPLSVVVALIVVAVIGGGGGISMELPRVVSK